MVLPYPTFGVELEFAMPTAAIVPAPAGAAQHTEFGLDHLANWIHTNTTHPLAVQCMCTDDGAPVAARACLRNAVVAHTAGEYCVWREFPDNSMYPSMKMSNYFHVQSDDVLPAIAGGWAGLEIATPALPSADIRNNAGVFKTFLRQLLGWPLHRIAITQRCGLHVHIGEPSRGLTLTVAKRAVTLVTLLERGLLQNMVTAQRRASGHWLPITTHSRLAADAAMYGFIGYAATNEVFPANWRLGSQFWTLNVNSYGALLDRIWAQPDLKTLSKKLLSGGFPGGAKCLLGISARDADGDNAVTTDMLPVYKFSTIELRYPQGSLCQDFIEMWVLLGSRIMEICRSGNPAEFTNALNNVLNVLETEAVTGVPATVDDFLGALGFGNAERADFALLIAEHNAGFDRSLEAIHPGPFRRRL